MFGVVHGDRVNLVTIAVSALPTMGHAELLSFAEERYRMGMAFSASWTRDMVLALPDDGRRFELLEGELLATPAPSARHQDAVLALIRRLDPWVRSRRAGHLSAAPCDLELGGGNVVQPDVFVVPLIGGIPPRTWSEYGVPLLVVEVLSPSSARADRITKRLGYQRTGVGEYWVVDIDAMIVERWRPSDGRPEVIHDVLTWQPDPELPALSISLPELFAEIPGSVE